MNATTIAALLIFAITYVLASLRRVPWLNLDRPGVALMGAVAMVACGALPLEEAWRAVNLDTLALLLGMMVVIAYLRLARFFEAFAATLVRVARSPRELLVGLVFAAGLLSALFVNDTICLLFTPVLLAATKSAGLPPLPYLLALCTASNVGSVATLTGNPQNMLIGISSGIGYGRFLAVQLPIALLSLALVALLLLFLFRRELPAVWPRAAVAGRRVHRALLVRLAAVVLLVLLGFLLPIERLLPGLSAGQKLPLVALGGAVMAMVVGRYKPARAFAHVDFGLLVFFSGLFVVVAGLARTGLLEQLHAALAPRMAGSVGREVALFSAFTVVGSNLVSNVPFVLVARDWIDAFANRELMWLVLATASTFAGNLTLVGSVANLIVAEQAKEVAPIGFLAYLRVGLPVTLLTTAVAVAALAALASFTSWI